MKIRQTYICEPVRTPVGKFGGAYKPLEAQFLGATVVKGLLERTGLPGEAVEDVLFAQCYSSMDAPALGRVVALDAGLPTTIGPGARQLQFVKDAEFHGGVLDKVLASGARQVR